MHVCKFGCLSYKPVWSASKENNIKDRRWLKGKGANTGDFDLQFHGSVQNENKYKKIKAGCYGSMLMRMREHSFLYQRHVRGRSSKQDLDGVSEGGTEGVGREYFRPRRSRQEPPLSASHALLEAAFSLPHLTRRPPLVFRTGARPQPPGHLATGQPHSFPAGPTRAKARPPSWITRQAFRRLRSRRPSFSAASPPPPPLPPPLWKRDVVCGRL